VIHVCSLSATSRRVFEPAKINRRTIFEFERATETAFENGFINGDRAAGRAGASLSIRLIRGNDDLDSDGTFGSIAVVLEFQSVILMGLCTNRWILGSRCFEWREPESRTFQID
jgi:hypothetical protein